MAVDAGTIYSEIRVKLDKLTADVKSVAAEFDKIEASEKKVNKTAQVEFQKTQAQGTAAFATITESIKKTIGSYDELARKMQNVGGKMTTFVSLPLLGVGAAMVKTASDMEMFQVNFETLLQSTDKAKTLISSLKDFAAKTPFGFEDLAAASKTMLGFGISLDQVMPNLQMLGDIAQGNKDKLASLTLAFSQIQSTGRLMGQDLLQLINAGFNPLTVISEKTGQSMASLKKAMEAGAISAEQVSEAFKIATSEGGRFFGGMDKASKTTLGKFSTLIDDGKAALVSFGELLLPLLQDIIAGASNVIKWIQGLDENTKKMILTIGGIAIVAGPVITAIGGIASALITLGPMLPVIIGIGVGIAAIGGSVAVVNQLAHGFDNLYTAARRENDLIRDQIARYEELKKKTNLSNQELAEMEKIKQRLIELDPSLKNGIDANTGALNLNEEALRKVNLQMLEREKLALETQKKTQQADVDKRLEAIKKESLWTLMTAAEQKERLDTDIALGNARQKILFTDQQLLDTNKKIKEIQSTMPKEPEAKKPVSVGLKAASVAQDPALLEEFAKARMTDVEREISEINKKAEAYKKAGADKIEVEKWASAQIDNIIERSLEKSEAAEEELTKKKKEESDKRKKEEEDNIKAMIESIKNGIPQALSAFSNLFSAIYEVRIKELDKQMQAELEAAGVAEDTAVEKARKELEEAKKGGDKEVIVDKEKALKRAQIEEEYQKKKAKLEYEAAHLKWQFDMANAIATGAVMVMNAWNSAPFPFNTPALVISGIIAGVQIAAVAAAEPKFESGGIVPGNQFSGDHIKARVNSGEMILTREDQANLLSIIRGTSSAGDININNNWGGVYSNPDFDRYNKRMGKQVEAARRARG